MAEFSEATARQAVQDWWNGAEFVPQHFRGVSTSEPSEYVDVTGSTDVRNRVDIADARLFDQVTVDSQVEPLSYALGYQTSHMRDGFLNTVFSIGTNEGFRVDVPGRMFDIASIRGAGVASYAHAIDLDSKTLTIALWDDGSGHSFDEIAEVSEARTDIGSSGHASLEEKLRDFPKYEVGWLAAKAIYNRGKVVFASNDQRMTLDGHADYNLRRRDEVITPLEGNVTIFQVPYLLGGTALDYVRFHSLNAYPIESRLGRSENHEGPLTLRQRVIHNKARVEHAEEQLEALQRQA